MTIATLPLIAVSISVGLIMASETERTPLFVWNPSESVPVGLYVLRPMITPTLGDLAAVQLPSDLYDWATERGYLGADTLLLKRVAATSGMEVCRDGLSVSVNGIIVAMAGETDRNGRPLPSWTGPPASGRGAGRPRASEQVPERVFGRSFNRDVVPRPLP